MNDLARSTTARRNLIVTAVFGTVIAVAAMFLVKGNWVWPAPSEPTVTGEVSGTVTLVNQRGDSVCLAAAGTGEQVCSSILWPSPGGVVNVPSVGDTISVWVVRIPTGPSAWMDQFVVKPAGS